MASGPVSKYDAYFESIADYLGGVYYPPTNTVDVEISKLDAHIKFKFCFRVNGSSIKELKDEWLFAIWSDWDAEHPLRFFNKKTPISVEDLTVSDGARIRVEYVKGSTNFIVEELDQDTGTIEINFTSANVFIPLSESTPNNRHIIHLNVGLNEAINHGSLLIRLMRPLNISTRFTKGNHRLAFPSRTLDENRATNIYFDSRKIYSLKIGFSDADLETLTAGWNTLLQLGFILTTASLLLSASPANIPSIESIGSIVALAFSLLVGIPRYFQTTRLKYYTGKTDVNSEIILISTLVVGANLFLAYICYMGYYQKVVVAAMLTQGLLLLIISLVGLLLLHIGLWERYVCDANDCENQLHNRNVAWNCFYSGRVMCNDTIRKRCQYCPLYVRGLDTFHFRRKHTKLDSLPCQSTLSDIEVV